MNNRERHCARESKGVLGVFAVSGAWTGREEKEEKEDEWLATGSCPFTCYDSKRADEGEVRTERVRCKATDDG
jgi:hypothetical protein